MIKEDFKVPLSEKRKKEIIQAVFDGCLNDMKDFKREFVLATNNSTHFLSWDFIYTNLTKLIQDDFQIVDIKRGRWEFLLLYDKTTKFLYSLMRENRFRDLQKDVHKRDTVHYIDALASINQGLKSKSDKQINFLFDVGNEAHEDNVQILLNEMLRGIKDEIKLFSLLTFSTTRNEVTSFTAYIPMVDLDIAHEENWNEFIPAEFDIVARDESIDGNEVEDIKLTIRKDFIKNENHDLSFKSEEKEDKEEE